MPDFKVIIARSFHSSELYSEQGGTVPTLESAVSVAETLHGADWKEVFNGSVGISREEVQADAHWLFHYAESLDHQQLGMIYDDPPTVVVIEYSSGFAVRHLATSEERWMSDGVDCLFDNEDRALSPGGADFTAEWSAALNNPSGETLEAYFPELVEVEDDY
jgi:hypothetical protein